MPQPFGMPFIKSLILSLLLLLGFYAQAQQSTLKLGKLKYRGGGDWYANPTSIQNLAKFCNQQLGTSIDLQENIVDVGSPELFRYPFIHMTGHGNVVFSREEAENLRNYLIAGGFLHIDDNYGMDKFIRLELKKVFPDAELIELPFSHPIYHQKFNFASGPPKIHEHDNKPSQGFGILWKGRLVLYYTFETDLSDGWEDPEIHNDPPEIRAKALQMGANMIQYIFTN